MIISGHIFQSAEVRNTMQSFDVVARVCKFGLVNFLDNQTGFFKFMNVIYLLFSTPVVVLVSVTSIPEFSLLLTRTSIPVTTTSLHVAFEIFYCISSLFVNDFFQSISPFFRHVVMSTPLSEKHFIICVL